MSRAHRFVGIGSLAACTVASDPRMPQLTLLRRTPPAHLDASPAGNSSGSSRMRRYASMHPTDESNASPNSRRQGSESELDDLPPGRDDQGDGVWASSDDWQIDFDRDLDAVLASNGYDAREIAAVYVAARDEELDRSS